MNNHIIQLLDIMAQLRDPIKGCPWDIEQSFESLTTYTIEEAYEVAEYGRQITKEEVCTLFPMIDSMINSDIP